MDPAPGYDADIPHDLIHYLVEAELALTGGLYGRLAAGGGSMATATDEPNHRDRRRQERRRRRREQRLRRDDHAGHRDMATSEQLAGICCLLWKARHGQAGAAPDPARIHPMSPVDQAHVDRVLARLNRVAPLWRRLPVGGSIAFTWPDPEPTSGL